MTQGSWADSTANIPVGASASKSVVVTRDMTVAHFHDDMPEVYGTPMMIYLMEVAAAEAIARYLPPGWGSVGAVVNVKHLAATPVGFAVTARAEVVSVQRPAGELHGRGTRRRREDRRRHAYPRRYQPGTISVSI